MFKRSETAARRREAPAVQQERPRTQSRVHAVLGPSLHFKGDIIGNENLTIDGTVEGNITIKGYSLGVGRSGRVLADVRAATIRIEGHVEGNLFAEEQVIIGASGVVRGNITAPRLAMEDGCSFRGSVDMEGRERPEADGTEPDTAPSPEPMVARTG